MQKKEVVKQTFKTLKALLSNFHFYGKLRFPDNKQK